VTLSAPNEAQIACRLLCLNDLSHAVQSGHLHIVSLHHRNAPIERIGQFHVPEDQQKVFLSRLKTDLGLQGLAYLTTCNRVEFIMVDEAYFCMGRLQQLFQAFEPTAETMRELMSTAMVLHGDDAVRHLFRVGAGLESMVLGEREILTQLRLSMEKSRKWKIAGDQLRITERVAVETAKRIFTETDIARRSVSVNALGWKAFKNWGVSTEAPILMIGAGQTNANIARYLSKEGYRQVHVLNRTPSKAEEIARPRHWTWGGMDELDSALQAGPAAIFLCTGSAQAVLNASSAQQLPEGTSTRVLDLSVPAGIDAQFKERKNTSVIGIAELKPLADKNTEGRRTAWGDCHSIIEQGMDELSSRLQQRQVELALRELPDLLASVRSTALGEVFSEELAQLDEDSRDLVDRIVAYLEKKYVSLPMKLAKEVVMEQLDKG
jgi:glutamyl-tRNA reductase